jgi:hypothetical protein
MVADEYCEGEPKDFANTSASSKGNDSSLKFLSQEPNHRSTKKVTSNKGHISMARKFTKPDSKDTLSPFASVNKGRTSSTSSKKDIVKDALDSFADCDQLDPSSASLKTASDASVPSYVEGDDDDGFVVRKRLPRDSYHQYLNKFAAAAEEDDEDDGNGELITASVRSFDSEKYSFQTSDMGSLTRSLPSNSVQGSGAQEKPLPSTPLSTSGYQLIPSTTNGSIHSDSDYGEVTPVAKQNAITQESPRSLLTARSVTITPAKVFARPKTPKIPAVDGYFKISGGTLSLKTARKAVAIYPTSRVAALELLLASDDSKDVQISFLSGELVGSMKVSETDVLELNTKPSSMHSFNMLPSALEGWLVTFPSGEAIPDGFTVKAIDSNGTLYYARGPYVPDIQPDKNRNSFAKVTIDDLVERYPELKPDLDTLRTSIKAHERSVRLDRVCEQLKLKNEINE